MDYTGSGALWHVDNLTVRGERAQQAFNKLWKDKVKSTPPKGRPEAIGLLWLTLVEAVQKKWSTQEFTDALLKQLPHVILQAEQDGECLTLPSEREKHIASLKMFEVVQAAWD